MDPRPLPNSLRDGPFAVAAAHDLGVSDARLRRGDLITPTRGARAWFPATDLTGLARAFQMGLAERTAFSHVTAAKLHGLPLPAHLEARDALDVMTTTRGGQVLRRGCVGHRGLERRTVNLLHDLRVTSLAETWCDLADLGRRQITADDLVVIGDAAVRQIDEASGIQVREGSLTSPGVRALHEALGRRVRPRGKVMLSEALRFIRPRVRSPMESRTRLMFVRAEFPEPVVGLTVWDAADEWIAEGDLGWREQRTLVEYQGAVHADRARRSEDAARIGLLHDHDWVVHEAFAEDVLRPARRVSFLYRVARSLALDTRRLLIA